MRDEYFQQACVPVPVDADWYAHFVSLVEFSSGQTNSGSCQKYMQLDARTYELCAQIFRFNTPLGMAAAHFSFCCFSCSSSSFVPLVIRFLILCKVKFE
jgi:hypothetical protein